MSRYNRKPQALNQKAKKVDMDKREFKVYADLERRKLKAQEEFMQFLRYFTTDMKELLKPEEPKKRPRWMYTIHYTAQAIESAAYLSIILVTLKMFRLI